jgi:ABC-2 type transport system permease protein
MSTATDRPRRTADPGAGTGGDHQIVRVSVPERSFASELRAIRIVWRRELIRFRADRIRMITSLVQPLLFLFVLGSGLQGLARAGTHGVQLKTFIYPGILCIAVMFTAMFSAASIVWDREFGFLREMMVAPIRRSSIVIGKCLGGATVAGFQGVIVICLAGLVHVPYAPLLILGIFGLQLLLAFSITAFGVMIAVRIKQMQSFMGVMQMVVMPMFFISGALFPVSGLPGWLAVLNRLDPLTYAVDPMRRLVFNHLTVSAAAKHALDPGVTWWGWHVPGLLEAGVIAVLGLVMLGIAIWEFSATE